MSFFNAAEPIVQLKQEHLDIQDLRGLLQIHWKFGQRTLLSTAYTRIDQVFVVWGWVTATIFATAQFLVIDWCLQAIVWSLLTGIATVIMTCLAWFWVKVERLRWVIYLWTSLMVLGVALTDYGIFGGCGAILLRLCPIWLALTALGYFFTGFGMRSRAFILAGLIHLFAIPVLNWVPAWQFLATGVVMAGSLLFLAEVQWDMRPPIELPDVLTLEEQKFNQTQQQLRQIGKAA